MITNACQRTQIKGNKIPANNETIYELIVSGYFGKCNYSNKENIQTTIIQYDNLQDALNKKSQYEQWAKINDIPPYDIKIKEINKQKGEAMGYPRFTL